MVNDLYESGRFVVDILSKFKLITAEDKTRTAKNNTKGDNSSNNFRTMFVVELVFKERNVGINNKKIDKMMDIYPNSFPNNPLDSYIFIVNNNNSNPPNKKI
jgi:FKBP-type peptidyl-prolyl cis-trans isomerase (trigger factor)